MSKATSFLTFLNVLNFLLHLPLYTLYQIFVDFVKLHIFVISLLQWQIFSHETMFSFSLFSLYSLILLYQNISDISLHEVGDKPVRILVQAHSDNFTEILHHRFDCVFFVSWTLPYSFFLLQSICHNQFWFLPFLQWGQWDWSYFTQMGSIRVDRERNRTFSIISEEYIYFFILWFSLQCLTLDG